MMSKLGDLAMIAISAAGGNAMNEIRHMNKRRKTGKTRNGKRSNGK
jgi:hypothetical protein